MPVRRPSCVSEQHIRGSHRQKGVWAVFDKRYWPGDSFADHLTFALRHEELDLLILKRIFGTAPRAELEALVQAAPTGIPARRAWYLYEGLTGDTLDVDDAPHAVAVDLLDPKAYFTGRPKLSRRHRVRDNLPGTARFSPIFRRTKALADFLERDLAGKARETMARPAPIWWREPQVSCCWPTAAPASRSKGNDRRGAAWNDGGGLFCRRAKIH